MENLRALRRTRSLTFLDLAALTGIPARQLAEIEYGLRRLSIQEREALALVLGLSPGDFTGAHRRPTGAHARAVALPDQRGVQALLVVALAATVATGSIGVVADGLPHRAAPPMSLSSAADPIITAPTAAPLATPEAITGALDRLGVEPTRDDAEQLWQRALVSLVKRAAFLGEALSPALLVGPTPGEEVAPAPLPVIESLAPAPAAPAASAGAIPVGEPVFVAAGAFMLTDAGPLGCPVVPTAGRVVMTQGYGVGSHAPAEIWGAVDLAVDGNGDGYAEQSSSWYQPIVATHDGHVSVALDSYPGGNHVSVTDPSGVWRTGYSHLALVTVVSGQFVRAGEQIGLLGSTGMSTGPHLDYQVWHSGVNIDPTGLVGCR